MAQQLFTTTDGKECRPVNPYEIGKNPLRYEDFEENAPTYPIHSDKPIDGEFEGNLVYQYKFNDVWVTDSNQNIAAHNDAKTCGMETRQVVQPVPVKGEGKPFNYEDNKKRNEPFKPIARRYETGKIGFYDAMVEAHALASANMVEVEKVVEVVNRVCSGCMYVVGDELLKEIKQLTIKE